MTGQEGKPAPPALPFDEGSAPNIASGGDLGPGISEKGGEMPGQPFSRPEAERYARQGELGRGGMGRVVNAVDQRLDRAVALKLLRSGQDARRMAREARITARLEHPGIVPVYDAGLGPDGVPFYTMRLVRGRSMADELSAAPDPAARLLLLRPLLAVAQAVAYAHAQGVVHRDLKPANLMLGAYGEIQVVDWGLARLMAEEEAPAEGEGSPQAPSLTQEGAVLGTPSYMSPEQAAGGAGDARSDVWSLGVILFELVRGQPPFGGADSATVLRRLQSEAPPRLQEPPELAAIVNRALERDPDDRYPTAAALAEDLRSYLDGRRVEAYAYTPWELSLRLLRAWRLPITLGISALGLLATVAAVGALRTAEERDRAVAAEALSRAEKVRADASLAQALVAQAGVALLHGARAEAEILAAHALVLAESAAARGTLAAFGASPRPRRKEGEALPDCEERRIGPRADWLLCEQAGALSFWSGQPLQERWRREGPFRTTAVSADGQTIAVMDNGSARLIDPATGQDRPQLVEGLDIWPTHLSSDGSVLWQYAPQNPFLMVALGEGTATARRIPVCEGDAGSAVHAELPGQGRLVLCSDGDVAVLQATGAVRRLGTDLARLLGAPSALAVLPGGDRAVVGSLEGAIAVLDLETGALSQRVSLQRGIINAIASAPDGDLVAVRGEEPSLILWRPETGAVVGQLPSPPGAAHRFTGNNEIAVLGPALTRWALPDNARPVVIHTGAGLTSARIDPQGHALATTAGDGHLRVYRLSDGSPLADLALSSQPLKDGDFDPSGDRYDLVGIGLMGVLALDPQRWTDPRPMPGAAPLALRRVAARTDGGSLGLPYADAAMVFHADGGVTRLPMGQSWDLSRSPDGQVVLVSGQGGLTRIQGQQATPLDTPVYGHVALDPAGRLIGVTDRERLLLLDPAGRVLAQAQAGRVLLQDLAISPDGRYIAAGDLNGDLWLWTLPELVLVARMRGHQGRVSTLSFAPDGRLLASASWDATARLWDLGQLDADPTDLLAEIEAAWGLGLDDVLEAPQR